MPVWMMAILMSCSEHRSLRDDGESQQACSDMYKCHNDVCDIFRISLSFVLTF